VPRSARGHLVDELQVRSRERLALGVTQARLEGRIDALPKTVKSGHRDQVRSEGEQAVYLSLRLGSPRRVDAERASEGSEDEAGGEDDPRQDHRRAGDRFQRHGNLESLSGSGERAARGCRSAKTSSGGAADGELHRCRVGNRCAQRGFRHEQRHERRPDDPPGEAGSEPDEKEPLLAVS
jgi:hypothetical protein